MANINDWSTTAGSNNAAAPNGWPEGMNYSDVNDTGRENMAVVARFFKDINGSLTTTGAANTYAVTLNSGYTSYFDGMMFAASISADNTGASTINVNGLGARSIVDSNGSALKGGELQAGQIYTFRYDGTDFHFDGASGPLSVTTIDASGAVTLGSSESFSAQVVENSVTTDASRYHSTGGILVDVAGASGYKLKADDGTTDQVIVDASGNHTIVGNYNAGSFNSGGGGAGNLIEASGFSASSCTTAASFVHRGYYNPNGLVGSVTTNGTTTSFITSSDPRLKSEFTPFNSSESWAKFDQILLASGKFHFLTDPTKEVWGFNAHSLIDSGLDSATEGKGPRGLNIGDVYEPAVIGQRPVLDEDGNDTGEVEDYEVEPAKVVTPAGVDQSKIVPYLIGVIQDLRERIEALEP